MKLFVSFDCSYINTVEDHFIALSHTIKFYIWCKHYVGVSHCNHHKEKCHPRNPKSNAYSSSSSNHFITFSHMQLFTFSIGCKYYVCVISHCHQVSSSTRQPESITHRLLSLSSRIIYALVVATYIANTVLELLQRSESEDRRRWTPSLSRHFFHSHICIRCSWVGTHTEAF